ncbi:MAG: HU family DNA-binding protein, partial [Candidatus Yonathbacteria bacterium]|nr:HU family DNA-binding protein [Candidatus Yonathbacteria bacterium]
MNKAELIESVSTKLNLPKNQVADVVETALTTITETLKTGGDVTFAGFGQFLAKRREARMGVNPRKPGEKISIPAVTVPKFKAGKSLKDAL